jgi:hypothetical protein
MKNTILLFVGAVVGGIIGYYGSVWFWRHGFYAMVLPGGLLGIGAAVGKSKSILPAILCCIAAIVLGLFTDWSIEPFQADDSLGFYFKHISDLEPVTFLMIAAGAFVAFWLPFRRIERAPTTST